MDHDQRFKIMLQEFFADFLQLFFADWALRLDCQAVQWIDKEVFSDPPEGRRRVLDLVGKVPTRQGVSGQRPGDPEQWLALVHIEIESPDRTTPLKPRLFRMYANLRDKYELPVLPIGLFLKVGLEGIGIELYEEYFWEFCPVTFRFLYVGLPALDGLKYVQGDNWLGVALSALMKIPKEKVAWLGAEALRRLVEAPLTDQQKFLLAECVQAYLPLDEAQQQEYERIVAGEPYQGVTAMNTTWFEKGIKKGREEGREEGREIGLRDVLPDQLQDRFGPLPDKVLDRLQKMSGEELTKVGKALVRAKSLKDLGLES